MKLSDGTRSRARPRGAFTLIELLVVLAIIAILAAVLFPVLGRAKEKAKQATCVSNLRQVGMAAAMYLESFDERLPDRRDLKSSLPGDYRPWSSWPPSDPRCGWAAVVFEPYIANKQPWSCPAVENTVLGDAIQVRQPFGNAPDGPATYYWMWRFDSIEYPVPLDNLWGKTELQAVEDLRSANDPLIGMPDGPSDVELAVDPYFPRTIPSVPDYLKGRSPHFGGRSRLFLDAHARFLRDRRTSP